MPPKYEKPAPPANGNRPSHDYTTTSKFIGRPQEQHADLGLVDDDRVGT
jgi:hypothetical protein